MKNQYFKYRSLYNFTSTGKREVNINTESIFKKAELFYSAPQDFNDPFDCNLKLHVDDSTDAEWDDFIDEYLRRGTIPADKLNKAKADKSWKSNPKILNMGETERKNTYIESSVCCFGKIGNSIPMFSYYADSHSGIAIEFSFSNEELPCGIKANTI